MYCVPGGIVPLAERNNIMSAHIAAPTPTPAPVVTLSVPAEGFRFVAGGKEFVWDGEYLAKLPGSSILALARRGAGHVLGNEVASKVSAFKAGRGKPGDDGYVAPVTDETAIAEFQAKAQAEKLAEIEAGTLGVSRGESEPRLSPLDAIVRDFAIQEVSAKLERQGVKLPSAKRKDEVVMVNGKPYNREALISTWINAPANAERLRRDAEKELAARARRASKAAAQAEEAGDIF